MSDESNKVITTVANRHYQTFDIYIGRGSKWGNPFKMVGRTKAERHRVIELYKVWFWKQEDLVNSLDELKGKVLGCYCKPAECHGDFLSELVNNDIRNESEYMRFKQSQSDKGE